MIVTGGDPAGVGPEILLRVLPEFVKSSRSILLLSTAGASWNAELIRRCSRQHDAQELGFSEMQQRYPATGPGLRVVDLNRHIRVGAPPPGRPDANGGRLAFFALQLAAELSSQHAPLALLTAPLSKEWVVAGGAVGFVGHTDFLAEQAQVDVLMLMHGRRFSVVPLTIHLPLRDAPSALKIALQKPSLLSLLQRLMELGPFRETRMAFCGLNPHSGEGGILGTEERDWIEPWCERARQVGLPLDGPISADGLFMEHTLRRYRLVLACYHDQGLIPFKALEGMHGVNVTLGLPYVRISPDHGVAFDIAGKDLADPGSMRRSFELACEGAFLQ